MPRIHRKSLTLLAALLLAACSTTSTAPVVEAEPGLVDSADRNQAAEPLSVTPPPAPPSAPVKAEVATATEARRERDAVHAQGLASKRAATAMVMSAPSFGFAPPMPMPPPVEDRENYAHVEPSPLRLAAEQPVSTFSIDVDTGSYSNMRRFLGEGRLPPGDAVRVEEFINYFDYGYAPPRDRSTPFAVDTEVIVTPWNAGTRLLRIGIQGYRPSGPLPPSNLVFLVDVSGSMNAPDKLPLVKSSLKLLTRQLQASDRISLVTYAGSTAVVLEPTPGDQTATIEQAIDRLDAGGGTAGGAGIQLAYQQAEKAFIKGGNNRILLATDGDFNVGLTRFESLIDLVKEKRKGGVAMTTLGFGTGNYNDQLMEQVADAGDGNYSYIDSLQEAQKVLVAQRAATLLTIARDVKIQVEFNPALVSEYRLIGYENRALKREDFNNDQVDAGDIGAGHSVTALYEIALVGEGGERIEPLRYGQAAPAELRRSNELAFVRLRYKQPTQDRSRLIEKPVRLAAAQGSASQASDATRLAAAVAAYGQQLKGGTYLKSFSYADIIALARGARAADGSDSAGEFLRLVALAQGLSARAPAGTAPAGE